MKVFYDGFIFKAQRVGGISRYFQNLIAYLPSGFEPHLTVTSPASGQVLPQSPRLITCRVPTWIGRLPRGGRFLSRLCLRGFETLAGGDVYHPTFYETLLGHAAGAVCPKKPLVLTVHDMLDEIFAPELDPHGEIAAMKRTAIQAADAILCVSQSTRHDLQKCYAIPDARIVVTPLATSLRVSDTSEIEEARGAVPEQPYVLVVGNRDVYKNFVRTLFAFARAREAWRDLTLRICGAPFNHTEAELVRVLKLTDAIYHLGFVSDEHLTRLYQNSEALLYPSLYEGFGIPPLEAMACGTVVITSNRSSLPEVVGDAALLVNPESIDEITDALLGLRSLGSTPRATLVAAGKKRAAEFSWAKTAQATAQVYRALAA